MLNNYPWVTNFTPFCFTVARFADNWGFFYFSISYNGGLEIFEKKKKQSLKIGNPKFQKSPTLFCENHWGESSWQVWKLLVAISRFSDLLTFYSNIWRNVAPLWEIRVQNPWLGLSRSHKVKCNRVIGFHIYGFLLMVNINSNIEPSSAPLRDIMLWNVSNLDFDLSRSFKWKSDGVIGLPIYGFLYMVNSNIRPNSAPLRDMMLWNRSDLDVDLSMSLKVKSDSAI